MRNGRILGIVPARLGSHRLPRKPLVPLNGRPLIEWVWRRVSGFALLDACVIATDSEEVATVCAMFGAPAVMTATAHRSGTERVAEVAARPGYDEFEIVVNVQGDEPLITEDQLACAVEQVRHGYDIGTVATPIREIGAWLDPSVVKVTRRSNGAALYFSRAPIPHCRDGDPDAAALSSALYLRHVGVYACQRDALMRWMALSPHPLEETERLEQLRPLAAGMQIGVGVVEHAEGGVDTPADVVRMEARLREIEDSERSRSPQART